MGVSFHGLCGSAKACKSLDLVVVRGAPYFACNSAVTQVIQQLKKLKGDVTATQMVPQVRASGVVFSRSPKTLTGGSRAVYVTVRASRHTKIKVPYAKYANSILIYFMITPKCCHTWRLRGLGNY